jgi:hypothetical protein
MPTPTGASENQTVNFSRAAEEGKRNNRLDVIIIKHNGKPESDALREERIKQQVDQR